MLKKIIGIVASVCAVLMFLIEPSLATCFNNNFKFERGNREKNIQAIIDYGKCIKKESKARVGKYFCYVENMVGIQVDDNKNITSGNIKPSHEKFFATIEEISEENKRSGCDWGEFGVAYDLSGYNTNRCLANYTIKISDDMFSGSSTDAYSFFDHWRNFTLFGTNEFVFFKNYQSSYVSSGKCEKVN